MPKQSKAIASYNSVPPKHIVEAVLADCLVQVKLCFDEVYYGRSTKLNRIETLVSTYAITRGEVEKCLSLFEEVNPKTLAPKHRKCVEVLNHFQKQLENTDLIAIKPKRSHHKAVIKSAKQMVEFLKTFHLTLHEDTGKREREKLVWEYLKNGL